MLRAIQTAVLMVVIVVSGSAVSQEYVHPAISSKCWIDISGESKSTIHASPDYQKHCLADEIRLQAIMLSSASAIYHEQSFVNIIKL